MSDNPLRPKDAAHTRAWQERAFPWMVGVILFFSVFFVSATAYQLLRIQDKIDYRDSRAQTLSAQKAPDQNIQLTAVQYELEAKKSLETYVIDRRYHQGNMLLTSRIWIQYLGFLVGTILVLIGAVFILGKMQEPNSNFDSDLKSLGKLSFTSSSPGLLLAFFGTVIIASTLFYHPEITTEDASLYMDRNYQFDVQEGQKNTADKVKETAAEGYDEEQVKEPSTNLPVLEDDE